MVIDLLLCLISKLNFIMEMYAYEVIIYAGFCTIR